MFRLNREIETKSGEILKPFLVQGKKVHSFDQSGRTIIRDLTDFDFETPEQTGHYSGIKMVSPLPRSRTATIIPEDSTPADEIARPTLKTIDTDAEPEKETITVIEAVKPDEVLVKTDPITTIVDEPVTTTVRDFEYEDVTHLDDGDLEIQVGGVKIIEKEVTETTTVSRPETISNEDYI